jgi:hypothetical protein
MTLTSALMLFTSLIVHPSLSGIFLVVNPLSVQTLEKLLMILHVMSRFPAMPADTLRDLPLHRSLTT